MRCPLPPLKKGGEGGFTTCWLETIPPPSPPFVKGGGLGARPLIWRLCPLGEGRVRGVSASNYYKKCKAQ